MDELIEQVALSRRVPAVSAAVDFERGAGGAFQGALDPGWFEAGVVAGEVDPALDGPRRGVVLVYLAGCGHRGLAQGVAGARPGLRDPTAGGLLLDPPTEPASQTVPREGDP